MQEAGYVLGNLDATIIAQKPKLSPHKVVTDGQGDWTSQLQQHRTVSACYSLIQWQGCL